MYEIKRAEKRIEDQIKIGERVIDIEFDIPAQYMALKETQQAIVEAQVAIRRAKEDNQTSDNIEKAIAQYGVAIVGLFNAIFGPDDTTYMIEFFQNNYQEMLEQTMPYINDKFLPLVQAYVAEQQSRQQELIKQTKAAGNRAQRRANKRKR